MPPHPRERAKVRVREKGNPPPKKEKTRANVNKPNKRHFGAVFLFPCVHTHGILDITNDINYNNHVDITNKILQASGLLQIKIPFIRSLNNLEKNRLAVIKWKAEVTKLHI